ncbi:MAG: acyl-CoA mutase large subunit family protein [Candidatus Delongbacteria bacterium]|nr:acyl-CoA mutase large subunit family protein [Candidatus Delongbacteria bacterium]
MGKEKLFKEFTPEISKAKWMVEVESDLKGKPYEKIWWKTYDGFQFEPYYKNAETKDIAHLGTIPGQFPYLRGNKCEKAENSWEVRQEISNADPKDAVKFTNEALSKGAKAIDLILHTKLRKGNAKCKCVDCCDRTILRGMVVNSEQDMKDIVTAVGENGLNITAGVVSKQIFSMIKGNSELKGSIDNDPLKELSLNGSFAVGEEKRFAEMKDIFEETLKMPKFKGLVISNDHYHDSGATITQKIAYLLSSAVFYKDRIANDISIDDFADNTVLSYSIGQNYLMEIAGMRALRLLWSNIVKVYDENSETKIRIHARTGIINKTKYDAHVNILRTTTEAMSAVIGGCNSLTVLPYDVAINEPDSFSMRIARNTELVLGEEAHLDKYVDPAAGSYYIEKLTDSIAKEAWKLFQEIEENGGMLEALKKNTIQSQINEVKNKRIKKLTSRQDSLVGTNHVPNNSEEAPVVRNADLRSVQQNNDMLQGFYQGEAEYTVEKLKPFRISEIFEEMRADTEKFNKAKGKKITAFMATMGNLTMRKARASFSMGFLGAAGIEVIDNNGFASVDEAIAEFISSGSEIAVICASDDDYTEIAADFTKKIKAANPNIVVILAGYPKELIDPLTEAGIDEFIHVRSDSVETLRSIQKKLKVIE